MGRAMSVSRGLRLVIVLGLLLLLSVVASGHGADKNPPHRPVPDRTTPPPVVVSVRESGFHWADAGVGAAAMLATTFLALGVALAVRPDRRSNRGHEALSSARREGS
jgi:hypothetical protein